MAKLYIKHKRFNSFSSDLDRNTLVDASFVNNVNKKDTIVKIKTNNNYTEIVLFNQKEEELSKENLLICENQTITREFMKSKRIAYFENLRQLLQNNLSIVLLLFLFFLCVLPVSFLYKKKKKKKKKT